jgi:maltodextrin utilization protein YvdJ
MRKVLISVFALAIMAIVVIGLLDFDLMLEIWVKVLIGVLFAGFIFAAVKRFNS